MADVALAVAHEPEPVETELKLSATSTAPLRRLAEVPTLGGTPLGVPETYLELDRYLDTDDSRLTAAKWACRLRSRSRTHRVSLKGPSVSEYELGGALHRRPEIEGVASARPDPSTWPPSAARDRLVALAGGQPLKEQLTLRQRRTQRSVGGEQDRFGTLSLDRVLVVLEGEPVGRLWCVELELAGSAVAASDRTVTARLRGLLSDLLGIGGLTIEPLTKLERALELVGRARS